MSNEKTTATCQCCFRTIRTKGDTIIRHGWKEAGGQRRRGGTNDVFHTGPCCGTGFVGFEISCERTKWYVADLRTMRAAQQDSLAAALDPARRPAKLAWQPRHKTVSVMVEDDGSAYDEDFRTYGPTPDVPPYMSLLLGRVRKLRAEIASLDRAIADLDKRIANWKAA